MSVDKKRKSGFFSRFKKNAKVAPLSGAALFAGGSATSSTISGSDNSAATSRNLQNASKQLDQYLREMDDNDERLADVISMSRFIEKSESYSNSSFTGCALRQVTIDPSVLVMVDLAAKGSKKVYNKPDSIDLEPFAFVQTGEMKQINADQFGGSVKATEVCLYKAKPIFTGPEDNISVLLVAIRGTASIHDWLVNFNDAAQETTTVRSVPSDFLGKTEQNSSYTVHEGFLKCAEAMAPMVAERIQQTLREAPPGQPPVLLFTGHSAGGAVATMLYGHLLKSTTLNGLSKLRDSFATVHCITFGAPTLTVPAFLPFEDQSTFISFVNEGDPIPRCDRDYVNSLIRLFVSPMPKDEVNWPLPKPLLYNAGQVVLIPKQVSDSGTIFVVPNETGKGSLVETVMGNPKAHKMDAYLNKVRIAKVILDM